MFKKILCAVVLSCLIVCPVIAAEMEKSEDGQYIIVEVNGQGKDRNAAIESAWLEAIRMAAGNFIDSKTEVVDNKLTESIISYSRGLVARYEITSADDTRAAEGIYKLTMRVWVAQDLLRDGVKVATNKTATVAFSPDDLKPDKEELNAKKMEERDALAATSKAKAETGVELLTAMLERYKPEDFISVRMVGKVTPVKNSDNPDLCQVVAEVSFNDKYYYEKFVPDLKQVLDQISSRHKEIRLTKQRDIINRIVDKKGAPLANDTIIMTGSDLGKDFFVTVYDKPDRFGCTVYAFSKDDADKILNNQTGVLAKFKGRIATIKSFQLELLDDKNEIVDTVEQDIALPFLLSDSVIRDKVWAFHPTLMGYAGMYCYVPLYRENAIVNVPLRFEMPEEFQKLVTSVNATPVLDDALADAAIKTRQACHQTALTFLTTGEGVAKSTFESASETGYTLARAALESINAAEIWSQRGELLLEEVVDRLRPMAEAGNFAAIYDTFLRFELDAGNFENQKKSVPYLTMAAMLDPRAMIRMGEVQEQGFYGVKPDKKKAEMYYKEGTRILSLLASQGLPCAAVELGHVYLEGLGTKQDTPRAERYYKFAQKSGYGAPEFWFWENYGIAMRQIRIRQDFIQSDEGKVSFQGRNSSEFLERSVPNSSKNPQTCIYLIREKKSVLFMTRNRNSGGAEGLVNVKVANLCGYLFNVIQENYNNRDKPSIYFANSWSNFVSGNYDATFEFKGNKQ